MKKKLNLINYSEGLKMKKITNLEIELAKKIEALKKNKMSKKQK